MACRTASAIWTWPGRSAPPMSATAAARSSATSGTALLTLRTGGTSERYLAPPSATTRRGPGQVRRRVTRPVRLDSIFDRKGPADDECGDPGGRLRPRPGDRAQRGAGDDQQSASGTPRAGGELDRLAGVAPDPGAGRPRGRRVRGAAGVDRVRETVRAAVRAVRHRVRAYPRAGCAGHGPVRGPAHGVPGRGARADRPAGLRH